MPDLTWRFLCVLAAVALCVLAAFGVGDGDPDLFVLGVAAFFASFLDSGPRTR